MSKVLEGKIICGGVAVGKLYFYGKKEGSVRRELIADTEAEIARYEAANKKAVNQLKLLHAKAVKEVGEINARIFESHQMILEDDEYRASVRNIISMQSVNAEYAVTATGDNLAAKFANMDDEYFKERSIDVKDVSRRLLSILTEEEEICMTESCIIMADELTPSEAVQLDKQHLLGFVTKKGSVNSHTAIIAGMMNIPALTDIEADERLHGKTVIVDGFAGKLIVEPDQEIQEYYQQKIQEEKEKKELLLQYKGKETINKFGKRIHLYANIGDVSDLPSVVDNDAEGIGLFRSEFLYLKEKDYPTEEALFQAYKQAAETMDGRKVVIRTMDIGADKKVDYFKLNEEENPALGFRAIRICLTREEMLRTQLRAILRASAYGNVSVMYPMITSLWEVRKIKEVVEEVKQELDSEGIAYGAFGQGIMIETPAAALISDILAKEVDFFSIGTNDLAQYTLAVDRQNPELDAFYDAHHEAILRLIRMTVENGHREGIQAGVCGELAADLTWTDTFMELGVDELSVAPGKVLEIRKAIIPDPLRR